MKRFMAGLACLALVAMSSVSAMAGTWLDNNRTGSINGYFSSFTPTSGALNAGTTVTNFNFLSGADAFSGLAPVTTTLFAGTKNFDVVGSTIGDSYTFTDAVYGTFVGTITNELTSGDLGAATGVANLTYSFIGTFTPGSSSFYEGDNTTLSNASFQITFGRTAGGTVSASWSLDTAGSSPVPEPTSIAIFGLGAAGLAVRRFRRK